MTAALVVLTMPLAAGCARYGLHNAYFWVVSCLIMYTVALPGYAHDHPMPLLALWRLACTAIGLAIEFVCAVVVFPVTARAAAHAVTAGALRGMADVADVAFRSALQQPGGGAHSAAADGGGPAAGGARLSLDAVRRAVVPRRFSRDGGSSRGSSPAPVSRQRSLAEALPEQQQQAAEQQLPGQAQLAAQPHPQQAQHQAITCSAGGWQGNEVATGAMLRRIHQPMMAVSAGWGGVQDRCLCGRLHCTVSCNEFADAAGHRPPCHCCNRCCAGVRADHRVPRAAGAAEVRSGEANGGQQRLPGGRCRPCWPACSTPHPPAGWSTTHSRPPPASPPGLAAAHSACAAAC